MTESGGPLFRIVPGHECKVVGNVANFLSEEERDGGHGVLDIDAVSFELLDTFGYELVIMYKGPQVSN
jgi:hypothetical protein